MKHVLPEYFFILLLKIRENYEARENIKLNEASQPYALNRFFGATDVETRNKQIYFIEKMLIALAKDLLPSPETDFNQQKYLTALQVLVTVCLYIKSQVSSSSTLGQLIDEAMGLTSNNALDPETYACCLLSAERFIKSDHCLESINSCLEKQVSSLEWHEFANFVSEKCKLLDEKYVNNYPITSFIMPIVAKPCELAGYTLGWVFGNWVGKSASLLSTHTAVTVALGSGLVWLLGPSATLGVLLITPTLAGQLIETYCGISLAYIMGTSMNLVGNAAGFTVGISLDLSIDLVCKAYSLLTDLFKDHFPYAKITGISLIDGVSVVNGIPLKFEQVGQLPEKMSQDLNSILTIVDIDEKNLTVRFKGAFKKIPIPPNAQELLNELKMFKLQQELSAESSEIEIKTDLSLTPEF